ncbi:MAG: ornithine carbamoyltransferase [Alphaproteobacteria bacterium]|nr:ornithine carbamoyltransferase [Alphaproteobacteria bacterium]
MKQIRHFLDLDAFDRKTLDAILRNALRLKQPRRRRADLAGKTLAMIFEKPSTRTRVSFELAMKELGGDTIVLSGKEMQLGHGESLADTARVMGGFVHALMIRTFAHSNITEMAAHAGIPVINALTNFSHPCQVMADLLTAMERFKTLKGLQVAWCGDGNNNVLTSWMHAAGIFDFSIRIAAPASLAPDAATLEKAQAKAKITYSDDLNAALKGADIVLTDTWASMHDTNVDERRRLLTPYQIDAAQMQLAKPKAIFMHCLPAHRGEEVTNAVMDSAQSVVWDEAENRLHVQKAILLWCFGKI